MKTCYIGVAVGIPILVGIVISAIWVIVFNWIYNGNVPQNILQFGGVWLGFFGGLGGVVQIFRSESPINSLGRPIRGTISLISGIIITLFLWSFTLVGLIVLILDIK